MSVSVGLSRRLLRFIARNRTQVCGMRLSDLRKVVVVVEILSG